MPEVAKKKASKSEDEGGERIKNRSASIVKGRRKKAMRKKNEERKKGPRRGRTQTFKRELRAG